MKRHASLLVLAGVLAALGVGVGMLFQLRLTHGDVFPAYSSLRSDPLGLRVLHDSLERLPSLRVERRFQPLRLLESRPPRTILFAGVPSRAWDRMTRAQFQAIDDAVKSGSRLVIALQAKKAGYDDDGEMTERDFEPLGKKARKKPADKKDEPHAKEKKGSEKKPDPGEEEEDAWEKRFKMEYVNLAQRWGVAVKERLLTERGGAVAVRGSDAGTAALPSQVPWHSSEYFEPEPDSGWREIYRRGGKSVLIERTHGRGSIVLATDAYFLSNEALQRDRAAPLLAWIVGANARVVFDEAHLGVVADPGVAALARRYGLSGAFFTLVLLAALFVWRRMALFVPPAPAAGEIALTYHPAAGLEALLRRAVPADQVVEACAHEWKPSASEGDRRRAESALGASAKASVVDRYNAVVRALRKSGGPPPAVAASTAKRIS